MSKKYTILVLPQDSTRVKSLSLPKIVIQILFFVSLIALLVVSWIIYDYSKIKGQVADVYRLRSENRNQKIEIQSLANKLTDLENQMVKLRTFDKKLRIIANLEKRDEKGQFFGIGGPSPEEDFSLLTDKERKEAFLKELNNQMDLLKKEALDQEKSFSELHNHLLGKKALLASTPSIWPTRGWLTSGFGYRKSPFTGLRQFHEGLDIANRVGTPVIAPANGIVTKIGVDRWLGKHLVINHGYGIVTKYGHLSKILVKKGKRIKRGEVIARMGNTGRSTGPHLHYTVVVNGIAVNPKRYILN